VRVAEYCFGHLELFGFAVHLLEKTKNKSCCGFVASQIDWFNLWVVFTFWFHWLIKQQQTEHFS